MKQEQQSTSGADLRRGPSFSLIAALVFLVISLAISGLIVAGVLAGTPGLEGAESGSTPVSPDASPAEELTNQLPQTPTPSNVPPTTSPEMLPEQPTAEQDTLVISLAALSPDGDQAIGGHLASAIRKALETSALPLPADILVTQLSSEVVTPAELDMSRDAPGSTLLVVWDDTRSGPIRLYLLAETDPPPIAQLGETPVPWTVTTPGSFPIYAGLSGVLTVPAEIVVGSLEILTGDYERALGRARTLQVPSPNVPSNIHTR